MPIIDNKDTIKSYFIAGAIPSESNYVNLIDSTHIVHDTDVDGNSTGIVIEPRNSGINRVIKLETKVINDLIKAQLGSTSVAHNRTITINQSFKETDEFGDPIPSIQTFTLNQNEDKTINIVIPNGTIKVVENNSGEVQQQIKKTDNLEDEIILSKIAFSGDWNDVQNKPTIPDADSFSQVNADWAEDEPTSVSFIRNKPNFADGELFVMQNGSNVKSYFIDSGGVKHDYVFRPDTTFKTYYEIEAVDWEVAENAPGGIKNKPLLAKVSYTGNYNDLFYKPGAANNPPIIIYKNKTKGFDSILKEGDEGSGATATATTKISVTQVQIMDGGSGYVSSSPPNVVFSSPIAEGGILATGTANVSHTGSVTSIININSNVNCGYSFATPPTITIDPPAEGGSRATGFAILEACLDTITVVNGGSGYNPLKPPKITVVGGNNAVVTPIISDGGQISGFTITERGENFTGDVSIIIGPAPIIFTLNQPNKEEYDLEMALVGLTGDFDDLDNKPTIGDGAFVITLNNNELIEEENRFNANSVQPVFLNINAATNITIDGDVYSDYNIPVDEQGYFHINTYLMDVDITRGPDDLVEYVYNGSDLIFDVLHGYDETLDENVQSFKVDNKGRVISYKSRKYKVKLPNVIVSNTGDIIGESGVENGGNIQLDLILKDTNPEINVLPVELPCPLDRVIGIKSISNLSLDDKGRVNSADLTNYKIILPNVILENDVVGIGVVDEGDIKIDTSLKDINPGVTNVEETTTCPVDRTFSVSFVSDISLDEKGRVTDVVKKTDNLVIPNITLSGGVTGSGVVNNGNIEITTTLESHTHDPSHINTNNNNLFVTAAEKAAWNAKPDSITNVIPFKMYHTNNQTTFGSGTGWFRIAALTARSGGIVDLSVGIQDDSFVMSFAFSSMYSDKSWNTNLQSISLIDSGFMSVASNTPVFEKIRLVYRSGPTTTVENSAFIEIYKRSSHSRLINYHAFCFGVAAAYDFVDLIHPVAGSIPSGYTSKEINTTGGSTTSTFSDPLMTPFNSDIDDSGINKVNIGLNNENNIKSYINIIEECENRITTLESIGGKWVGFNFNTFYDLESTELSRKINNGDYIYVIHDEFHPCEISGEPQLTLYRWVDEQNKFVFSHVVHEDPIGKFTNNEFGLLKGENKKPAYINAQNDGTGKVNLYPRILDYDNETKNIWLDCEIPDGYCLFGFNKGVVSESMDLRLISSDLFSYKYEEINTSVLEDISWKKFYARYIQ